jgi:outer membrane protein OmpA-like peptidoglycan-associated protein
MTRARPWFTVTMLAALMLAGFHADSRAQGTRLTLVPFAGRTIFDREFRDDGALDIENGYYFGGRAAAQVISPVWFELAAGMTPTRTRGTTEMTWYHGSANLLFTPAAMHAVNPFASVGLGFSQFSPQISSDRRNGTFEAAGGVVVRITHAVGLRLEARNVLLMQKEDKFKAHLDNIVFGAGLSFGFGGRPRDTDGDGVSDRLDKCPGTIMGCRVDAAGCPLDSDGDAVCDGIDQCPATPIGARVDAHGCPSDADGDAVYDGIDQCPGTARGCTVDAKGCTMDADGDGVCDGIDKCANTPAGCKVDERGCILDADADGVCDGNDKCPDTGAGVKVDASGCPVVTEVQQRETELLDTGLIRLNDINFETDRADILPASYPRLDIVGEVLSKWTQLKIEIGGHCDWRGSDAYNLALSRRRAAAVRTYLLEHFTHLEATQLSSRGYGETEPVAPNTTVEGMARNRRVEFKVLNTAVLKQIKR